ncbi:MAG: hypothetical protein JJE19_02755 [Methanosarcinales archaeon]|nr:hypothetical protein [Methanosarcinales archaeon]
MVKARKSSSDPDAKVVFEAPLSNLKGQWLQLLQTVILNCSNVIVQDGAESDRFHYSFLLLLNLLPGGKGGKDRHLIFEAHKKILEERMDAAEEEAHGHLAMHDRRRIRQEVELETIGSISDYIDENIGIKEKLIIDRTVSAALLEQPDEEFFK